MSESVLVDSDILIDAGRGVKTAIQKLSELSEFSLISISSVTVMELLIGCQNKREVNHLENFLENFEQISLNESISNIAIKLLKKYRLSHGLLIADSLIAATSLEMNYPLLTKNVKDFRFIEQLKLLTYP